MERVCFITLITLVLSSCSYIDKQANNYIQNALTDTTFVEVIPQNVGGNLICEVRYWDDFSEVTREINYIYESTDNIRYSIGKGVYSNKTWTKNEQIQRIGNWNLLKTSFGPDSERILIGQLRDSSEWMEFEFSPESVENENLWKQQKTNSNPNNYDSKVEILSIDTSGEIIAEYKYAEKGRIFSFITGQRKLLYALTQENGHPILTSVSED
ncbi:MAG: hypothetical protein ABJG41_01165 [Cyclobacteriaceae bacterium]